MPTQSGHGYFGYGMLLLLLFHLLPFFHSLARPPRCAVWSPLSRFTFTSTLRSAVRPGLCSSLPLLLAPAQTSSSPLHFAAQTSLRSAFAPSLTISRILLRQHPPFHPIRPRGRLCRTRSNHANSRDSPGSRRIRRNG
jgi:hypothetical protein